MTAAIEGAFSLEDFRARAKRRLHSAPPDPDDPATLIVGEHEALPPDHIPRRAAVLIGVVPREEPQLLLTERSAGLRVHAGQIAFPGGGSDPQDVSPLDTALREAEEEIGLDRRLVRPLGYLDLYVTVSGYGVVGCVAEIAPDYRLRLSPDEVADAFEAPLGFLMDEANSRIEMREWRGAAREVNHMPWRGRNIWGVTAGIIRNMRERLYGR